MLSAGNESESGLNGCIWEFAVHSQFPYRLTFFSASLNRTEIIPNTSSIIFLSILLSPTSEQRTGLVFCSRFPSPIFPIDEKGNKISCEECSCFESADGPLDDLLCHSLILRWFLLSLLLKICDLKLVFAGTQRPVVNRRYWAELPSFVKAFCLRELKYEFK